MEGLEELVRRERSQLVFIILYKDIKVVCFLADPGEARGCSTNTSVIH